MLPTIRLGQGGPEASTISLGAVIGLAIIATALWELTAGGLELDGFELHPGMPAYLLLGLASLPLLWHERSSRLWSIWLFTAAVTLCNAPAMAARSTSLEGRVSELAMGMGITVVLLPLLATLPSRFKRPLTPSRWDATILFLTSILAVSGSQIFNRIMRSRGVSNEGRSLMIAGVEVHHVNWGFILVIAAVLLSGIGTAYPRVRVVLLLALGVGVGFIWDEWLYYMRSAVTDEAYFAPATVISAVGACVFSYVLWLILGELRSTHG